MIQSDLGAYVKKDRKRTADRINIETWKTYLGGILAVDTDGMSNQAASGDTDDKVKVTMCLLMTLMRKLLQKMRQMRMNDRTGNTPFSMQRSQALTETPDQPSLPNLPDQQHTAAVRFQRVQVERKADVDLLLVSRHAHEKSKAAERLQKETNILSETKFNCEVDNRKCLTCEYKTAETAGKNISTHDDASWCFRCTSWQMQSPRMEFNCMPVDRLFVSGRSLYEENDKPVFESLKLDKIALNETRFERRQMIAASIGKTGRKYLQQKQTQDCAVLVVTPLASRSCNLFLTRELPILDCKESVKMNLNSLLYKNEDTPEETIPEYEVCKKKEELEAFKEPENDEDVISMHRIYSDFAPGLHYGRQCDVENYKSMHDSGTAYTACYDSCARVPPIAYVTYHDANDTDTSCSHAVHEQIEILPIAGVCWSLGIHCQEVGDERVDRCTSKDELGSREEDFGMIEKVTADGSASTAVSESRRVEFKEALLFNQVDKLENVGNNENVSITLPSSKASTVPVAEELFGEKKEALALSRGMENEENNPGLKKNSDSKEPLNQNEDQTDKDVDDSQVLQNYYRHYRLRSVGQQRRQYFVYMLRSPQAAHVPRQGFENEMRRLATFFNFQPPAGVYVIRLANAGFFLPTNNPQNTGALNVLQMVLECAFCGVLVEVLKFQSRQPMEVHREASPSCPLVLGQDGRNVSIAQMAQTTGAHFLDTYPSPTAGASPFGGVPSRSNGVEYAIDGDGSATLSAFSPPEGVGSKDNAAAKPAFMAVPAQTAIVGFATVGQGQTVADARGLPSAQPPPFTVPALPRQTAAFAPSADCTSSQPSSVTPGNATLPAGTTQPSSPSREVENCGEGTGSSTQERQVVTYEQLGIFAQRPRRPDMAVVATRMTTFEGWPHAGSHPPSEMADAGFYYTGQADLVRCFHCRGGLRTWERSDHPWVEHGRWFPRCPFVRLCRGQKFVDAIQQLNENGASKISEEDVKREIIRKEEEAKRNRPAVVMPASPPPPSSGKTDDDRGAVGGATTSIRADYTVGDGSDVATLSRRLQEENQELKETTLCKMCQQREVNVLFLPCGHLVACAHCAPALRVCAICRQQVKGSVRVLLDEEEDVTADQ